MIVFCILRQAQSKVLVLTLINSEVSAYVFMNKFFTQQHHFFLHQLIHSCRLWEFDDQVTLIDDIIHVIEITMILNKHLKRLFFYVIELSQYLIIMSLSWLHYHVIDVNFEHNILIFFSSSVLIIVVNLSSRSMILINKKKISRLKLTK